jgi:hypothetical protein
MNMELASAPKSSTSLLVEIQSQAALPPTYSFNRDPMKRGVPGCVSQSSKIKAQMKPADGLLEKFSTVGEKKNKPAGVSSLKQ